MAHKHCGDSETSTSGLLTICEETDIGDLTARREHNQWRMVVSCVAPQRGSFQAVVTVRRVCVLQRDPDCGQEMGEFHFMHAA